MQRAPLIAQRYEAAYDALLEANTTLPRTFPNCVFPAATVNIGPRTVTSPHRDTQNYAGGWCAITALGDFDYVKGGHLILWSLGIALEFPAGSTVMIPSALIMHSNVPIAVQETRYSFTNYFAGQLLHWVDNGHASAKSVAQGQTSVQKADAVKAARARIYNMLDAFPDA